MTLLDDGLRALTTPREDGGGAGLVLGALAAAAGLAVLGAIEAARDEIDTLPLFRELHNRAYNNARRLACEPAGTIHDIGFGSLHEKDFALLEQLGWKDEQGVRIPTTTEERNILADQLILRGDPRGEIMALLLADEKAPSMQAMVAEGVTIVRNYSRLENLKHLTPGEGRDVRDDDGLRAVLERGLDLHYDDTVTDNLLRNTSWIATANDNLFLFTTLGQSG